MADKDIKTTVNNAISAITKELPDAVKENKGAVIGAALGYLFADKVESNRGIITSVLGGLLGHVVDEKGKK